MCGIYVVWFKQFIHQMLYLRFRKALPSTQTYLEYREEIFSKEQLKLVVRNWDAVPEHEILTELRFSLVNKMNKI